MWFVEQQEGIAGGTACPFSKLMHSRDGGAEMFSFGAHLPAKVHKMLLETGTTGLMKSQADSEWSTHKSPHALQECLQATLTESPGNTHFWTEQR